MDPLITAEVAKRAHDNVPFQPVQNHLHSTWARTFTSRPELYLQPSTLPEIEKIINIARATRRRITTVGCGHSPSNLTCTSSWLVNLDRFNRVHEVNSQDGWATVDSGIRLYTLCAELEKKGLAMPNLGSINEQSIAGAISTGTHGSSTRHGLMSEDILSLRITLSSGETISCSHTENTDLFRAATLSLGALGIITQVTLRVVPAFSLRWTQTIDNDYKIFEAWNEELWTQSEFVRVWWLPYSRRAVVWRADKTDEENSPPVYNWFDGAIGYYVYHNLLALAQVFPRIMPWIERFVWGMQNGFKDGTSTTAVQPSGQALLLNCLYSQYVNEWALPLRRGPEAIRRLSSWLNHLTPSDPDYVPHNIPFDNSDLYVHAPLEVRVSDTTLTTTPRPYLDPTDASGPTLYLNATLYRPYLYDPPCRARFYEAFEWLMKEMGGRPHWAKNFETQRPEVESMFGKDLEEWRRVRGECDPEGMFVGPWHREKVLAGGTRLEYEEVEVERRRGRYGSVLTVGEV